jgi:predicted O-methyltransferase YrrM
MPGEPRARTATALRARVISRVGAVVGMRGYAAVRRAGRLAGVDLVLRNFYSPVPDVAALTDDDYERVSPLPGIDLRLDAATRLLTAELAPFIAEAPICAAGEFVSPDAEVLHAIVRWAKPRRIVEIGSGGSTEILDAACALNAADGRPVDYAVFDPYASDRVRSDELAHARVTPLAAQDVPQDAFTALRSGDLLFIDSTHTVKLGGDVNRLFLEILPLLAPGVLVHVHDVFLPREYPRSWIEQDGKFWAEQYLLQAFLCLNAEFEVVLPLNALLHDGAREAGEILRRQGPDAYPGSFWFRRRELR